MKFSLLFLATLVITASVADLATAQTAVSNRSINVVLVEHTLPSPVEVGSPFDYQIQVTNLSNMDLIDVVVTGELPAILKFNSSNPAGQANEANHVQWPLGNLEAGAASTIQVNATASELGSLTTCATVAYKTKVCSTIEVIQPKLQLVKMAPEQVLLCDPIPMKFVVTNPGTGPATNVQIMDNLPEGLVTTDGQTTLLFDVGTLDPGESREFAVDTKASKTGTYNNTATASADDGLSAEASTTTVVVQPVLAITKSGTEKQILGRTIEYNITLKNTGDTDAENTVLEDLVPSGTQFISATNGGEFSEDEGKVVWSIGTLAPDATAEVSLTLLANQFGRLRNTAMAKAVCTAPVSAAAMTEIIGIPAILLEVIDLEDPIEVGGEVTYVITATNQGTAVGTNISIVATLEENQEYVSASGATQGSLAGQEITFEPLPSLAPKAKATWRVVVKAIGAGDTRFQITMNTDQLTREVLETEATHLFE